MTMSSNTIIHPPSGLWPRWRERRATDALVPHARTFAGKPPGCDARNERPVPGAYQPVTRP